MIIMLNEGPYDPSCFQSGPQRRDRGHRLVRFTVTRDDDLLGVSLVASFRSAMLDHAAVVRAVPFPPIPLARARSHRADRAGQLLVVGAARTLG
jgi:hypothetical protein